MFDRHIFRDVFIYDLSDKNKNNEDRTLLGGLSRQNGVTNRDFIQMVHIVVIAVVEAPGFTIQDEQGTVLAEDDHPLLTGDYYVSGTYYVSSF